MAEPSKRILQFSYLRTAACLAIVVLHTVFAAGSYNADRISPGQDLASKMVENNMMWAVPVFLMVTGALLLDPARQMDIPRILRRYAGRIFAALLLFCLVFRCFDMVMDGEPFTAAGVLYAFVELFTGKSWGHLWYLYLLIGLYLMLPFFRAVVRSCTRKELLYLCAVYTVFLSLLPMTEMAGIHCGFYLTTSLIYPLYLLCGYLIHTGILPIGRGAGAALVCGSTAALLILTWVRCSTGAEALDELFGYSSIVVIAQTLGIFALFDGMKVREGGAAGRILQQMDRCSFGIYLIHMIFVRWVLRYAGLDPYAHGGVLTLAGLVAGFFLASFLITWLLKLVPGLKRVM